MKGLDESLIYTRRVSGGDFLDADDVGASAFVKAPPVKTPTAGRTIPKRFPATAARQSIAH